MFKILVSNFSDQLDDMRIAVYDIPSYVEACAIAKRMHKVSYRFIRIIGGDINEVYMGDVQ